MSAASGSFVISLDFELHWGVCDSRTVDDYRENLLGARSVIPSLLKEFEEQRIHATWAIVGFLFFRRRDDLLAALPELRPTYANPRRSSYAVIPGVGVDEIADPFHFGRELVDRVRHTPFQEIATHTFSHYFCVEPGQTVEQFGADLDAAIEAAQGAEAELASIVFPRNQAAAPYVDACVARGIRYYRGVPRFWFYRRAGWDRQDALMRVFRLADSYLALSGPGGSPPPAPGADGAVDVPASRFLRPYDRRLRMLEPLKLRRITRGMTHAARHGLVYHLWWHPHNFGRDIDENLAMLRRILAHFHTLARDYGMRSRTMSEVGSGIDGWRTTPHPPARSRAHSATPAPP